MGNEQVTVAIEKPVEKIEVPDVPYDDKTGRQILYLAVYTWLFAAILCVVPIVDYYYLSGSDPLIKLLIYIGCGGGLGGIVFSVLGFTRHYGRGDFKLKYKYWYLFRPMIAGILGVIAFFFVAGGLMTLTKNPPESITDDFGIVTRMFYIALAFLTGFSTNNFTAKLKEISEAIFMKEDNKPEDEPSGAGDPTKIVEKKVP